MDKQNKNNLDKQNREAVTASASGGGVLTKRMEVRRRLLDSALYIILAVMIIVIIIVEPNFLTTKNFLNILQQASTRCILALGVAGMIVLTGTDLSAGRILGLCAAVTASMLQSMTYGSRFWPNLPEQNMLVPLLLSIVIATILCAINGFGVAYLKMHAFIISLGTQLIAYGLTFYYITEVQEVSRSIGSLDPKFTSLVNGNLTIAGKDLGIPNLVIYMLICAIIMYVIWNYTRLGKNMFAIGGNMEAAAVSGVNVELNIMGVYLVAGVLYGIASFLEAGRIQSVSTQTGLNYDLDAISGCVIGGVSFNGGVGTIPGVIIGVIILQTINYSLNFLSVNAGYQSMIKGLIIIVAVAIDVRKYIEKK